MEEKPYRVTLGVTAGIAIYKACDLVRRLREKNCEVKVVMTEHATKMVAPLTFQALSGNAVTTGLFDAGGDASISHIELAEWEDLLIVAPATADILGKFASGIADDFLTTHYLANRGKPVLIVPTMNGFMYRHPAVQHNLHLLAERGHYLMKAGRGDLACGDSDEGRMVEPTQIADEAMGILENAGSLEGVKVLVTAGGTREAIDAVRFISNRSSGKMGYALAGEAVRRGAEVTLISGVTALSPPAGAKFVQVVSATEMEAAVKKHFPSTDILVMAAAVSDYRPAKALTSKKKKSASDWKLDLRPTKDILLEVKKLKKKKHFVCGFAAETENLENNAAKKLEEKKLDLIAANDVSRKGIGFDSDENAMVLIKPDGKKIRISRRSKPDCAKELWNRIEEIRRG